MDFPPKPETFIGHWKYEYIGLGGKISTSESPPGVGENPGFSVEVPLNRSSEDGKMMAAHGKKMMETGNAIV